MELGADGPSNGQSSRISRGSNGAVTIKLNYQFLNCSNCLFLVCFDCLLFFFTHEYNEWVLTPNR